MKRCFKCCEVKPLDEFYRHPATADGHLGKCKECAKADVRANYAARRGYYRLYDRLRMQLDPVRREQHTAAGEEYKRKHPEKRAAHVAVWRSLQSGKLKREGCEVCGERAEAHHDDYSKPLDVRWLCLKHHRAHHYGRV